MLVLSPYTDEETKALSPSPTKVTCAEEAELGFHPPLARPQSLFPHILRPCPDPVPSTGPRGKVTSPPPLELRNQGPARAQANCQVSGLSLKRSPLPSILTGGEAPQWG